MKNVPIPPGENVDVGLGTVMNNPATRDLSRYLGQVTSGQLLPGNFMFASDECTAERLHDKLPVQARLTFGLATGEKQTIEFLLPKGGQFKRGDSWPIHGVTITDDRDPKKPPLRLP